MDFDVFEASFKVIERIRLAETKLAKLWSILYIEETLSNYDDFNTIKQLLVDNLQNDVTLAIGKFNIKHKINSLEDLIQLLNKIKSVYTPKFNYHIIQPANIEDYKRIHGGTPRGNPPIFPPPQILSRSSSRSFSRSPRKTPMDVMGDIHSRSLPHITPIQPLSKSPSILIIPPGEYMEGHPP